MTTQHTTACVCDKSDRRGKLVPFYEEDGERERGHILTGGSAARRKRERLNQRLSRKARKFGVCCRRDCEPRPPVLSFSPASLCSLLPILYVSLFPSFSRRRRLKEVAPQKVSPRCGYPRYRETQTRFKASAAAAFELLLLLRPKPRPPLSRRASMAATCVCVPGLCLCGEEEGNSFSSLVSFLCFACSVVQPSLSLSLSSLPFLLMSLADRLLLLLLPYEESESCNNSSPSPDTHTHRERVRRSVMHVFPLLLP